MVLETSLASPPPPEARIFFGAKYGQSWRTGRTGHAVHAVHEMLVVRVIFVMLSMLVVLMALSRPAGAERCEG